MSRWNLGLIVLVLVVGACVLYSRNAKGAPILKAVAEDKAEIVLYNEKCQLPAIVNLPYRATWTENGKTQEGCFGGHPTFPIFIFYFEDRTAFVIPQQAFERVPGA